MNKTLTNELCSFGKHRMCIYNVMTHTKLVREFPNTQFKNFIGVEK